jgi:hypothetical protein
MGKPASQTKSLIRLNVAKVKRVQKALGAKTEVEAIELALDFVIAEGDRNRPVIDAVRSGVETTDVYRKLDR